TRLEDDLQALGFVPMHSTPRASSAIPEIRGFIGKVLERGFAYEAGGSVYFDVARFSSFGSVSGYDEVRMLELARERGGNVDDPNKRHPLDFVLWQPSAHDEPAWDTIWGPGRPGWHIECSALALRELGTTIDLHGGGTDLIYPHHECERAQSEAATGAAFVKHWMHVAMVWMDGHKMSKSRGNLVFVDALRRQYDPRAIRLGLLVNHYRHEWEWDKGLIDRATARLGKWMDAGVDSKGAQTAPRDKGVEDMLGIVRHHLDDDLDTPSAIAAIDRAAAEGVDVRQAAALLGVAW
ncbi:MAG: cysteine--tRNA ligase, partial [Ilumatobacteraceae bacterium]